MVDSKSQGNPVRVGVFEFPESLPIQWQALGEVMATSGPTDQDVNTRRTCFCPSESFPEDESLRLKGNTASAGESGGIQFYLPPCIDPNWLTEELVEKNRELTGLLGSSSKKDSRTRTLEKIVDLSPSPSGILDLNSLSSAQQIFQAVASARQCILLRPSAGELMLVSLVAAWARTRLVVWGESWMQNELWFAASGLRQPHILPLTLPDGNEESLRNLVRLSVQLLQQESSIVPWIDADHSQLFLGTHAMDAYVENWLTIGNDCQVNALDPDHEWYHFILSFVRMPEALIEAETQNNITPLYAPDYGYSSSWQDSQRRARSKKFLLSWNGLAPNSWIRAALKPQYENCLQQYCQTQVFRVRTPAANQEFIESCARFEGFLDLAHKVEPLRLDLVKRLETPIVFNRFAAFSLSAICLGFVSANSYELHHFETAKSFKTSCKTMQKLLRMEWEEHEKNSFSIIASLYISMILGKPDDLIVIAQEGTNSLGENNAFFFKAGALLFNHGYIDSARTAFEIECKNFEKISAFDRCSLTLFAYLSGASIFDLLLSKWGSETDISAAIANQAEVLPLAAACACKLGKEAEALEIWKLALEQKPTLSRLQFLYQRGSELDRVPHMQLSTIVDQLVSQIR